MEKRNKSHKSVTVTASEHTVGGEMITRENLTNLQGSKARSCLRATLKGTENGKKSKKEPVLHF